jgi:hypothetical protein
VGAEGNGQHPKGGIETQREVSTADIAEPEMLASADLPPVAVERDTKVGRKGFGKEQLAFTKGAKGNRACGVSAFMKHGLGPIFSSVKTSAREIPTS